MASPEKPSAAAGQMPGLEADAYALAARIPDLLIEARRVAHTVTHGVHGRRRAGPGETFWQFRHFSNTDTRAAIDWRRSASSDHLFVRETEWEAAHTIWLWADLSESMMFRSHLSQTWKRDRALVLMLGAGELLIRSGERIGRFNERPLADRNAVPKIAEAVARDLAATPKPSSQPPHASFGKFSECLIFSDFLEPVDVLAERFERIAAQGVRGHLVQVLDPAEETLPYQGRTEFEGIGGDRVIAGRAEAWREGYRQRIAAHRAAIADTARRLEWSFLVHHTDRPPEEPLLALHNRLAGLERDYRYRAPAERAPGAADPNEAVPS